MITHVRVFAEFHGDNTHVYTNVREVFTLKAPDNVLNIRNSESGVSVCGLFFFCEDFCSYLWEREGEINRQQW